MRNKVLGWTLGVIGALLGLLVLVVGGAFAWLSTGSGREFVLDQARAAVPGLTIQAADGSVFDLRLGRLTMADARGVWLEVDGARLQWSPLALLGRTLVVDLLAADRVSLVRLPESPDPAGAPPPAEEGPPFQLPVAVDLDRLDIPRLELGEALLQGQSAVLAAGGSAELPSGELRGSTALRLQRIDDQPGLAVVNARFLPRQTLDLDIRAEEPAGGVIATLLDIPGRPPVTLTLTGKGPPTDWTGRLEARAGDVVDLAADARLRPAGEVVSFSVEAGGRITALLPPDVAPLVGPSPTVAVGGIVVPGQRVALDGITLRVAAGTAAGQGVYHMAEDLLNAGFGIEIPADSTLKQMLAEPVFDRAVAEVVLSGALASPDVRSILTLFQPAFAAYQADRLTLTTRVEPANGGYDRVALTAQAVAEGLGTGDPALDQALGPSTRLTVAGTVATPQGLVVLDSLALESGAISAKGSARAEGWGRDLTADLDIAAETLSPLSPLVGQTLSGALTAQVQARREGETLTAEVTALGRRLGTGIPAADALLGAETRLAATLTQGADGLGLPRFSLTSPRLDLSGTARLEGQRLAADITGRVPDLAPLGRALGTPLAGSTTLTATAAGPLDGFGAELSARAEKLMIQGRSYGQAALTASATGLPASPEGRLTLDTSLGEQPVAVSTRFDLDGQSLSLPELLVRAGENRVEGALTADLAGPLATGQLTADLPDLATIGAMAGQRLAGSGTLSVTLSPRQGRQQVTVEGRLRDLVQRTETGAVRLAALGVKGQVDQAFSAPVLDLALTADGFSRGGTRVDSLSAEVGGPLTAVDLDARAQGQAGVPFQVQTTARIGLLDDRTELLLRRLQGQVDGQELRLRDEARLAFLGQGFQVRGLDLSLAGGRVGLDADLTGQTLSADVTLADLPLALARLADPALSPGGRLSGQVTLAGSVARPRGDARLTISGFTPDTRQRSIVSGVDGTLTGTWRDGRLAYTLDTQAREGALDITAKGALPLVLAGGPTAFQVPPDAPVTTELDGTLQLSLLNDLLADSGDRVGGLLSVDLTIGGTLTDSVYAGTLAVADGLYENQALGTTIRGITAELAGDTDGLVIRRFTGNTPGGGTVAADGAIRFDPAFAGRQIDLALTAQRARLMQTDQITATADANLTVTGDFDQALLAGDVRVREARVVIPDTLPPDIVDLAVEEVNGDGEPTVPAAAAEPEAVALRGEEEAGGMTLGLKLDVVAPNQIYVQGRGLDAEFQADLDVTGTAEEPVVTGAVTLVKGELSLLGQTLELSRGTATFTGGRQIAPALDIEARTTRGDVTAIVNVTGTPSDPKVALSSEPPLPEDEVLAQLLFNRGVGALSALEALQLAEGAAQLAGLLGTGPGVLDRVKRSLGVDRLEFRGSEDGEGPGTVAAGRYIGNDVYVGVEQELGTGQSKATVEYDVNESIQLRGEVGEQSKVGVQFEWDY